MKLQSPELGSKCRGVVISAYARNLGATFIPPPLSPAAANVLEPLDAVAAGNHSFFWASQP